MIFLTLHRRDVLVTLGATMTSSNMRHFEWLCVGCWRMKLALPSLRHLVK